MSAAYGRDVTLAWSPNSEPDLAGYKLYYGTESGIYSQTNDVGNVTEYTVTGLDAGRSYFFALSAYDTEGLESVPSSEVVLDVTAPTVPTDLSGNAVSSTEVALSWSGSADSESGISHYNVYRDGVVIGQPAALSFNDGGLSESTSYQYAVSAVNDLGLESDKSASISVTTLGQQDLAAYWAFDEGSGNVAADGSGNGYDGTLDGAGWAPGRLGAAVALDGIDDAVNMGDVLDFSGTAAWTLSAWFKADTIDTGDQRSIVAKWGGSDPVERAYRLEIGTAQTMEVNLAAENRVVEGITLIEPGLWYHVAVTVDPASQTVALYLNGIEEDKNSAFTTLLGDSSYPLTIGRRPNGEQPFDGSIDEVRFYSRVLSAEEISTLSNPSSGTVNQVPVTQGDSLEVNEGGVAKSLTDGADSVLANDSDPDGDSLQAVLVQGPAHGELTLNSDGTFSYTHDGSETQSDSFTYAADDGTALSGEATVQIAVAAVNDAPVAMADSIEVDEGKTASVLTSGAGSVLANDSDAEGDTLQAVLVQGPANGELTLNSDGTFSYTHDGSDTASDSFVYVANDGSQDSSEATVTIDVIENLLGRIEGDVYPRHEGDGELTVSDWTRAGRMISGLEAAPVDQNEMDRVDVAPRMDENGVLTLGDGQLTLIDWVQVGRYVSGLDPLTYVDGEIPSDTVAAQDQLQTAPESPVIQILDGEVQNGSMTLPVVMNSSGTVASIAFSLEFKTSALNVGNVALGPNLAEGALLVNDSKSQEGFVGITVADAPGASMPGGTIELLRITFELIGNPPKGHRQVKFADSPFEKAAVDVMARPLAAQFEEMQNSNGNTKLQLQTTDDGQMKLLTNGESGQEVVIETSTDLENWETLQTMTLSEEGIFELIEKPLEGGLRFYRVRVDPDAQ
jgi:VCBS repeat-containing protein